MRRKKGTQTMGLVGRFSTPDYIDPVKDITGGGDSADLTQVIHILGAQKVVSARQASKTWKLKIPESDGVRYENCTFQQCANENANGLADWRLVFLFGLSLSEQLAIVGTNPEKGPCFYRSHWWLQRSEKSWVDRGQRAGYWLIDFRGRFGAMSWRKQQAEIGRQLHAERAPAAMMAEATMAFASVHNERLLPNWYHWGKSLDSMGNPVAVGNFDSLGLTVCKAPSLPNGDERLRACIVLSH
jgi:hypothetical protein